MKTEDKIKELIEKNLVQSMNHLDECCVLMFGKLKQDVDKKNGHKLIKIKSQLKTMLNKHYDYLARK